jgi:Cu+-exporting ATPase
MKKTYTLPSPYQHQVPSKAEDLNALDSYTVVIGTEQWMAENGIPIDNGQIFEELANQRREGNIAVCCAINGQMAAVLSIADEVKPEAALAIWALQHKMGLNVALLTGDHAKTADVIAKKV